MRKLLIMHPAALRVVALDCETTRRFNDPSQHRVIELYAATMQDPRDSLWTRVDHWLLDPGVPIPADATTVHGFADRDVAGKPTFQDVAHDVQSILDGAVLCAFNGKRHDIPLLDRQLRGAGQPGIPPDTPVLDAYEILCWVFPRNLDAGLRLVGLDPNPHPHSAEWDTRYMLKLVRELLDRGRPWGKTHRLEDGVTPWRHAQHFEKVDGELRFAFGKFAGQPAVSQPAYLNWMLGQGFPEATKAVARQVLAEVGA